MPHLFTLPGPRPGPDNISDGFLPEHGTHVIVDASTTIYASLRRVFWADHNHIDFTNHGTIWNIAPGAPTYGGTVLAGFYPENITNTGTIIVEAPEGNATALYSGGGGGTLNNSGSIWAIANGNAYAIMHWGPEIVVTNSGLIAAYAPSATAGTGGGGVGDAIAVYLVNGTQVHNLAGGRILAEGLYATAILLQGDLFGTENIRNEGLIEAWSLTPGRPSYGFRGGGAAHQTHIFYNTGIVRADIAWSTYTPEFVYYGYAVKTRDSITNETGGQLIGDVETGLGADQLINRGAIVGNVRLGDDNDVFNTELGSFTGVADLGWNDDVFRGGAGVDLAIGNRGADELTGNGGNDLLLGGLGDDMLIGGAGNDGLYGEYGDDRIVAAGGDRIEAGAGDDVIEVGDLGFALVDGGIGLDRLVLAIGPASLDLAAARATGRLLDIEAIEMQAQQRLVLRGGDVTGLAGEDTLRLFTAASSQVELVGGWTDAGSVALDGLQFRRFTLGGEIALVAGSGAVTISAAPSAPAGGLDPVAAGAAAPLPGSVAGMALSSPTSILNLFQQHGTETVAAYEIWRSTDGAAAVAPVDGYASLINYGLIESAGAGNGGAACISVNGMDLLENHGTMRATGPGARVILMFGGAIHLANYGLMEAIGQNGRATGASIGFSVWGDVNFENYGTISARNNGTDVATGAEIRGDEAGFNHGLISALGGNGSVGVNISEQRMFTNSGTIAADLAAGAAGSTTGMLYSASLWGSVFHNYGLIRGSVAIKGTDGIGLYGPFAFYNFGRLEGAVELAGGNSSFENWGVVAGDARLGAGINLWFGAGRQGTISGGDGADILVGSSADETLNGDGGDDYIRGGGGGDQLSGGAGRDIFVYAGPLDSVAGAFDTIGDFVSGTDRIDLSAFGIQSVSIQAESGFSLLSATGALGNVVIRVSGALAPSDLILAAAAAINGTSAAEMLVATAGGSLVSGGDGMDVLVGSAGNDRLDGGAGGDVLWGGAGDDVYVVDSSSDIAWEVTGEGVDLVELQSEGIIFDLSNNVENARFIQFGVVRGNALVNRLSGSAGDDGLIGKGGDDILIGGGGADTLMPGEGADWIVYLAPGDSTAAARDRIYEFEPGRDRIDLGAVAPISIGWTTWHDPAINSLVTILTVQTSGGVMEIWLEGVVNLSEADFVFGRLSGTSGSDMLAGTTLAERLLGLDGDDTLSGGGGNDVLDGGTGRDILAGGTGDDIYYVETPGDQVFEFNGEGFDRVLTSVDYTLGEGVYAERLEASDLAGTAPLALGGNALENVIYGNAGSNILYGKGGFDSLFGGAGDDYYYVSDAGDFIVELAGGGFDRILTSVDYSLNDEGLVEVISTDSNSGTSALALGGNNHENIIIGNDGDNILYGKGGFDTIYGRAGDDTYYVSDAGDLIVELQNEGNDRIYASVDYTLFDDGYVETLSTEFIAGTANLSLGGNNLANTIIGNAGNNILYGKAGADTLYGHGGADTFLFVSKGASDVDAIGDFVSGTDKIAFYQSVFTGLASGTLGASAFVIGSAAADGDDRIVYNQATGALFYDADGSGAEAAIQFATLTPGQTLAASDFVVL